MVSCFKRLSILPLFSAVACAQYIPVYAKLIDALLKCPSAGIRCRRETQKRRIGLAKTPVLRFGLLQQDDIRISVAADQP
jgi:hypothetical protein